MKKNTRVGWTALLLAAMTSMGCATILHGTKQDVRFISRPAGATVMINGEEWGTTPYVAQLKRKAKEHKVEITLDGYEPFELTLKRKFSGWYVGNLVFGGVIGLIVDPVSGGMYRISPNEVEAQLASRGASVRSDDDLVQVSVALNIDPSWERVGTLTPLSSN